MHERIVNVNVAVDKVVKGLESKKFTRVFELNINFLMNQNVKKVVPQTYKDAMFYLEGKRRVDRLLTDH